jgi:glycosyltransferase involved in cell wall biosynthesis
VRRRISPKDLGARQMAEPLVSIMMLTYNHAGNIARAIESVLHQEVNFPIELVIGEDASTDGTKAIVLEYQSRRPDIIRVITSPTNVGMKANNYRAIKACRGKYLAFCEGDDYWHHPGKLQKQADYLEGHPECGLVFSSYDVYHVSSKILTRDFLRHRALKIPTDPGLLDILDFWSSTMILTCTVMTRRTLSVHVIESDPYIHQSELFLLGDVQHWAEIATVARLHYVPESLATYNITAESATQSKDIKKRLRFAISNAEVFIYLCKKYRVPEDIRKKHEQSWRGSSLRLAFHSRDADLADEVRRQGTTFTFKEWLRYYGAKNLVVHYLYRFTARVYAMFRKDHEGWS